MSYLKAKKNGQQQISDELEQIRFALDRDFVPLYLGLNKSRAFFASNNTPTVRTLFEINENSIVFLCDG